VSLEKKKAGRAEGALPASRFRISEVDFAWLSYLPGAWLVVILCCYTGKCDIAWGLVSFLET
jgi:hypothetical protein